MVQHTGLPRRTVVTAGGVSITAPSDTWADVATLPGIEVRDLVVVGDAVVARTGRADLEVLREVLMRRRGERGVRQLRTALALVRPRSASPTETLTRLGLCEAGLPEPELNAGVTDHHGQWLAEVDFLWRFARVLAEYDGAHHADPAQFRRDARRRAALEAAGWTYVQITAGTLYRPQEWAELIARLRALLT